MATEKHELTDEAWTDLGPAPCLVQSVAGAKAEGYLPVAANIAFVFADAEPDLAAPAHILESKPLPLTLTGNVWARAENAHGALIIVSR